jgi:hypothetical protein
MAVDAIVALTAAFHHRSLTPDGVADDDRPVAAISWPAVPVELLRAAGLQAIVVRGGAGPTRAGDAYLETAVFPSRIRQLVDTVVAGRLSRGVVVLPRTSDPDYQCFLYLRELARQRVLPPTVAILLFDLLQSDDADVGPHDAARARALFEALAAIGGGAVDSLPEQIAHANAARGAVRRLLALRGQAARVAGAEVLPLIGAFWRLAPEVYAPLATAAADSIARRPPLELPRVLLLGAPIDGVTLHMAIEAHGAVVVGEASPWGTLAAGADVAGGGDPFAALAVKYRRDAWGPRTPLADVRRWTIAALDGIDAVVVSLPLDDAAFGWDYPWLRDRLAEMRLPHAVLTHDPWQPIPDADRDRLASLIRTATPRLEVRRG